MVGERRHPLLAQTPTAPAAHAPSSAHRQHVVAVPSAGVPGVGVRLMQEPGFAAHDSHLYARGRDQPGRPQDVQLAGRRQEEARRQRALSPGSQHSAAATFFARASQLAGQGAPSSCSSPVRQDDRERRRRRRRNSGERERDGSGRRGKGGGREERLALPTDYRSALAKFSPPVPHALLKKIGTKDVQGLGKVRVVLRVSPAVRVGEGQEEVVTLDKRRRQVTLVEPQARQAQESRLGVAAPKMFAFDQVYTQDDPQSEVVSGAVVDVLHAVLAGNDGCVLCFGGAGLGKTYTMLGSHTGPGELGVVPSAVAWLYRAIVEQKAKSGARFSVRVSAVAVDSAGAMLTDLLAEYAQEGEASPGALLRDTTGGYLSSVAELRAPSPEAAAHYLDVAIAARSSLAAQHLQASQQQPLVTSGSATLLYTLHIYQYAVDKSGKGGVVGGRSRFHMIDVGDMTGSGGGMSLSSLTSVLLAIFNGQRYLPNRESKLTLLLKEALGSVTCHAAMVVHVSPAPRHVQHTLATLQLASRVHRMRRKKLKGLGGSGSGGSSEGSHGKSSGETSAGSSSMDFSSSEQSCDTVIYIGGGGPGDTTDNEHPPVFMPHHTNQQVWPITRLRSMEHLRPHSASPTPAYTRRAASASPTPTSRSVPNAHPQMKPRPPPRTVSTANNSAGKVALAGGFIRHQPGVSHIAYNNNNNAAQQPLLSSFKPQVALGPLVPGDLRHFNYNAYEEPNNLVPMFQQTRLPMSAQMQNQRQLEQQQQQQQFHQQPSQQQQQQMQLQQQAHQLQKSQKHQQLQKVQQMQQQQLKFQCKQGVTDS